MVALATTIQLITSNSVGESRVSGVSEHCRTLSSGGLFLGFLVFEFSQNSYSSSFRSVNMSVLNILTGKPAQEGSIAELSAVGKFGMPSLVVDCVQFVYNRGLEVEGIFRVSPDVKEMQEVKEKYTRAAAKKKGDTDLQSFTADAHLAAHMLKDFLRKTPEPIFHTTHNEQLIVACKESDFNKKMALYSSAVNSLPPPNRKILICLAFLAKEIVSKKESNKMSYQALGVVFGPCLLRLEPMHMIEMWDSRVAQEVFGNFGGIIQGSADIGVLGQVFSGTSSFSIGPPITAKVEFMGIADPSQAGTKVDMEVRIAMVGDDAGGKADLFCACAVKRPVNDKVRYMMEGLLSKPLSDVASLDTGKKVLVELNCLQDWTNPAVALAAPAGAPAAAPSVGLPSIPAPLAAPCLDGRGLSRGACKSCDCGVYSLPKQPTEHLCSYCQHGEKQHKGACTACDCELFEKEYSSSSHACTTCSHMPTSHARVRKSGSALPPPPGTSLPKSPNRSGPPVVPPRRPSMSQVGGGSEISKTLQTPARPPPPAPLPTPGANVPHVYAQDYPAVLAKANVIVLCFSVKDHTTFKNIKEKWIESLLSQKIAAPMILVGTERELREKNMPGLVDYEDAVNIVQSHPCVYGYTEVSTAEYKGFRTLANLGLAAVMLDLQQKRGAGAPPPPSTPSSELSASQAEMVKSLAMAKQPSGSLEGAAGKDEKKDCIVM